MIDFAVDRDVPSFSVARTLGDLPLPVTLSPLSPRSSERRLAIDVPRSSLRMLVCLSMQSPGSDFPLGYLKRKDDKTAFP